MNRRKVGQYFREPDGAFAFTYAADWLAWENTMPISRSLPLRPERYVGPPVIAVFENLLPNSDDNVLFWLIGATDGHTRNFSIALMPGGRFTMTPLYDVLTVQPSLDAGQLQIKDMKLAMRAGKGRHYKVSEIQGRHFVETGLAAAFFARTDRAGVRIH